MSNRKTTICRAWSDGFCERDNFCGFAHGASELRRIEHEDGNYSGPPGCVDYMRGACGKGELCSFSHNWDVVNNRYADECNLDRDMPLQMMQRYVQTYKGNIKGNTQDLISEWEETQRHGGVRNFRGNYPGKGPPVGTKREDWASNARKTYSGTFTSSATSKAAHQELRPVTG